MRPFVPANRCIGTVPQCNVPDTRRADSASLLELGRRRKSHCRIPSLGLLILLIINYVISQNPRVHLIWKLWIKLGRRDALVSASLQMTQSRVN